MPDIIDPFKAKPAGIVDPFKPVQEAVRGQKADPSQDGDLYFTEDTDVPIDMSGVDPARKARVRTALKALQIRRGGVTDTPSGKMLNGALLGLPGLAESTVRADLTYAQQKAKNGKLPYSQADMRDAERLAARARRGEFQGKHPVAAPVLDVAGSLMMPGGKQVADWMIGKVAPAAFAAGKGVPVAERVLQGVRGAGVGGALTGTTAALQAAPGHEMEDARSGALTGAVMTPLLGGAAGVTIAGARQIPRLAARVVGRGPSAEITSVEKLQKALRQSGVTPDVINAASQRWTDMGGADPALIDLLKDANAAPEVLRLLERSASRVEQRQIAGQNAKTVGDAVDPTLKQALRTGPVPDVAPESGAATFADDLNRRYDASRKKYKADFKVAEEAQPETAIANEDEAYPLFEKLAIPQSFEEALPGVAAVKNYLAKKREHIVGRADPADWPEGEPITLQNPLTMLELQKMRQGLTHFSGKYADEPGGALAGNLKQTLNGEIDRLVNENKMSGDPAILDKWKAAIAGYGEHKKNFGDGLAARLTARKPNGDREVPSNLAAETIFGSKSLNKAADELGGSLDLVSPESLKALREELYGRVKPEDLPALRGTTGGKRLLPEDLVDEPTMAALLEKVPEQAQTAEALDKVVSGQSTLHTDSPIEKVTGGNIAYGSGRVQAILNAFRRSTRLTEAEYSAALKTLTSKDDAAKQRLLDGLLKKYPRAKRAVAPLLAKALTQPGDEGAVDALEEDYGVTTP